MLEQVEGQTRAKCVRLKRNALFDVSGFRRVFAVIDVYRTDLQRVEMRNQTMVAGSANRTRAQIQHRLFKLNIGDMRIHQGTPQAFARGEGAAYLREVNRWMRHRV